MALGAVVSTFGTLNGFIMLCGQVPYGAARDDVFPRTLARLSRYGTPAIALVLSNALATLLIVMAFSGGLVAAFNFIILVAVMSSLLPYALCALAEAMIYARTGRTLARGDTLKVAVLGGLGFVYALWALYGAGAETVFLGFLLLIAAAPIHVVMKVRGARAVD